MQKLIRQISVVGFASLFMAIGHAETAPRPFDPALYQLGGMFAEDALATTADVCGQRVPASREAWTEAARQWHEAHQEELAMLRRDANSIFEALKSGAPKGSSLDLGQFAMFRAQLPLLMMYGLATASDAKAYELCESLRAHYLDKQSEDQFLDQAQAAADAALGAVSKH